MLRRTILITTIVVLCTGIPVFLEWFTTAEPGEKDIHMEMFKYGTSPSIIRANRGDELSLTFETHDMGHSFLLQDYLIEAKVFPASEMIELRDPLDRNLL